MLRLIRVLGISGGIKTLTAALAALVLIGTAHAKVVYVDDNASAGGDETSWATAHKHLQDALAGVASGDEIWVAEGTYKPDQGAGKTAGDRTATFSLVSRVGMYGGFRGTETTRTPLGDGNQTILSGEINAEKELWSLHVVTLSGWDPGSIVIDGFRITKGNANGELTTNYSTDYPINHSRGGGCTTINPNPFTLTMTNCVFTGNSASGMGGGMYFKSGEDKQRFYHYGTKAWLTLGE